MRIRTIAGATMQDAMAKVREELGPDAMILSVEDAKSRKGVLVRAAADMPDSAHMAAPGPEGAPVSIETRLEAELRCRLRIFQPVQCAASRIDPAGEILPALEFHRLPPELAANVARIAGEAAASAPEEALAQALARTFGCGPMPQCPARPVIAVGAPGHGKTTALARLAAQAANAGQNVSLVTLDVGKAGAVAQIETYANLLKAQITTCEDAEALRAAISQKRDGAVFVDTPGINPWNVDEASQARQWIEAAGAEPVWIVSAETDPRDMPELAELYRRLGVRRMIATKLDAARRWGGVAAAAAAGPLALAGTISSPFLAELIEPPSHLGFARRLLESYRTKNSPLSSIQEAKIA